MTLEFVNFTFLFVVVTHIYNSIALYQLLFKLLLTINFHTILVYEKYSIVIVFRNFWSKKLIYASKNLFGCLLFVKNGKKRFCLNDLSCIPLGCNFGHMRISSKVNFIFFIWLSSKKTNMFPNDLLHFSLYKQYSN